MFRCEMSTMFGHLKTLLIIISIVGHVIARDPVCIEGQTHSTASRYGEQRCQRHCAGGECHLVRTLYRDWITMQWMCTACSSILTELENSDRLKKPTSLIDFEIPHTNIRRLQANAHLFAQFSTVAPTTTTRSPDTTSVYRFLFGGVSPQSERKIDAPDAASRYQNSFTQFFSAAEMIGFGSSPRYIGAVQSRTGALTTSAAPQQKFQQLQQRHRQPLLPPGRCQQGRLMSPYEASSRCDGGSCLHDSDTPFGRCRCNYCST